MSKLNFLWLLLFLAFGVAFACFFVGFYLTVYLFSYSLSTVPFDFGCAWFSFACSFVFGVFFCCLYGQVRYVFRFLKDRFKLSKAASHSCPMLECQDKKCFYYDKDCQCCKFACVPEVTVDE